MYNCNCLYYYSFDNCERYLKLNFLIKNESFFVHVPYKRIQFNSKYMKFVLKIFVRRKIYSAIIMRHISRLPIVEINVINPHMKRRGACWHHNYVMKIRFLNEVESRSYHLSHFKAALYILYLQAEKNRKINLQILTIGQVEKCHCSKRYTDPNNSYLWSFFLHFYFLNDRIPKTRNDFILNTFYMKYGFKLCVKFLI